MNCIDISLIVIPPNRQRRTHDPAAHQEKVHSLERFGLINPITLREEAGGIFVLVAGERRLRAAKEIWELKGSFTHNGLLVPRGQIPYTLITDLDPLVAREVELEENIRRLDLSWQDRAAAEAELLSLRTAQAKAKGQPAPTHMDITEEVGLAKGSSGQVRQRILLAKHLDLPEVAKAPTMQEAFKALKRHENEVRNAEVARALGGTVMAHRHVLVRGDCVEWMRQQPAGTFDVILTDPPYGMGADEFGDSGGATGGAHRYADDFATWTKLTSEFGDESYRITKPDAHLYAFCDIGNFQDLSLTLSAYGWLVFRTPLIWFKPSAYRAPWPDHGPQRKYECILYARKGDLRTTVVAGDVLTYQPDENLGHGAQKPVALFADLLRRSARPGMKVLDPFCGTGPIFEAAQSLSVEATGVEMDEVAYGIAAQRLAAMK